jgi:uncharacterized membrane protein
VLKQIVFLTLVTLIPALELRASIPYGILGKEGLGIIPGLMPWPAVVLVCVVVNIILGMAVFYVLSPLLGWLERFAWFKRFFSPILARARGKLKPYVDRYGEIGVAVFIGIPLPGSGVYTGAVGAFLLGLDRRKFAVANVIGVLIAGTVVTAVTLMLQAGLSLPWLEWICKH